MSRLLSGERDDDLNQAARHLCAGGLLAVPTETVYGLAGDARNESAVREIFAVKGRPLLDPLIVHVSDLQQAEELAHINEAARKLADAFWPGPLTLILKKKPEVSGLVTASLPTLAVRAPAHPVMRIILERSGLALAAPSANPFGYISPTRAEHVEDSLGDQLPYILDGGACEHGLESTILNLSNPQWPEVLRPGPISAEALTATLGVTVKAHEAKPSDNQAQLAPGMLSRHYSPRTPLALCESPHLQLAANSERTALLYLCRPVNAVRAHVPHEHLFWCTDSDSLEEAARELFALMRRLDKAGYARILAERAPDTPLGQAINNRLERAAAKGE